MSAGSIKPPPSPCAKVVLAFFGSLFVIALLSVPVTTRTTRLRQDPDSNMVFKTTYPRNSTMFLPRYLSVKSDPHKEHDIRVRSAQWLLTMVIIVVLGVFDRFLVCRLFRRPRRQEGGPGQESPPSGFSLFP